MPLARFLHGRTPNPSSYLIKSIIFLHFYTSPILSIPIDTTFTLPSPLPNWPQVLHRSGGGFAVGEVDLGGLPVRQVSTFRKVWTAGGGPDNVGATFFEPYPIPDGFSMLATYAQANDRKLFGWVLVGKTDAGDESGAILKPPVDYNLVGESRGNDSGFFWIPVPPNGYKAVGYVVTTSPDKPPLDKIRCVRGDFADESEVGTPLWATEDGGVNVYTSRTTAGGSDSESVDPGTFHVRGGNSDVAISHLKRKNTDSDSNLSSKSMPNLQQIQSLFQTYSPYIYLHPEEAFHPSSVNWFFENGALLYKKGDEGNPVGIKPDGTNLPQGGANDGSYWIDLPRDTNAAEKVKKGDLGSTEVYLHAKSVLGGTFTDIQVWIFYPFNGHAVAKLGILKKIPLGKIGEHVGDWEHLTLRISNFDGVLHKVYFAQHGKGQWVDAPSIEFKTGNKIVGYSALNSHASYPKPGLVLLGNGDFGIRDSTDKSDVALDTGARFTVVAGDGVSAVEPPWLNYFREWGPNRTDELGNEVEKVKRFLIGKPRRQFEKLIGTLPQEIFRQEGPTGPKAKGNWNGEEAE